MTPRVLRARSRHGLSIDLRDLLISVGILIVGETPTGLDAVTLAGRSTLMPSHRNSPIELAA